MSFELNLLGWGVFGGGLNAVQLFYGAHSSIQRNFIERILRKI